ncbi:TFIIB-type zinc ribbon-containing protein [Aurantivibrio infirmus]
MHCPKCKKSSALQGLELEKGLVAAACDSCEGVLLPLLNYRYWADREPTVEPRDISSSVVDDNDHALICPKCDHLMIKYQIGLQHVNKVDLCASCDEIWLDKGEWSLLKQLDIHLQLSRIVTDVWQKDLRQQRYLTLQKARYVEILGEDDYEKIDQFKEWMRSHSKKKIIKQFLLAK